MKIIKNWLNHEIPNKASIGASMVVAAMVGVAGNVHFQTTLGALLVFLTIDLLIYQIKHEVDA